MTHQDDLNGLHHQVIVNELIARGNLEPDVQLLAWLDAEAQHNAKYPKRAKADPAVAALEEGYRLGEQYQRDVQSVLNEQFGGDWTSPGWAAWCAEMDAYRAAEQEAAAKQTKGKRRTKGR